MLSPVFLVLFLLFIFCLSVVCLLVCCFFYLFVWPLMLPFFWKVILWMLSALRWTSIVKVYYSTNASPYFCYCWKHGVVLGCICSYSYKRKTLPLTCKLSKRVNILQTNNTRQRNIVSYETNKTLHVITLLYRDLCIYNCYQCSIRMYLAYGRVLLWNEKHRVEFLTCIIFYTFVSIAMDCT